LKEIETLIADADELFNQGDYGASMDKIRDANERFDKIG
jgi:hypothetical protein